VGRTVNAAMELPPFVFDDCEFAAAEPALMDALWAGGWRHFGRNFFRYSITMGEDGMLQRIIPLRIDLATFRVSKSLRRVARRNADLVVRVAPACVDELREAIFQRHKERFTSNVPETLRTFMPEPEPWRTPCECREIQLWEMDRLIAVSYLDLGREAASSVYAIFEPDSARRSPGIFTLLAEIDFARLNGLRFLYLGYATIEASHYDYKKRFDSVQRYDWQGNWVAMQGK
jgi:arginine-tRNA-protein transferase